MKPSLAYLRERHEYWKNRIGEKGIWEPSRFKPVFILLKPDCKSYNAMFRRRTKIVNGIKTPVDQIIIYRKVEDFDGRFLDNLLVHEMIHQYIAQAEIKDTSTHGRVFRTFMWKINKTFPDELKINITDRNPSLPISGAGKTLHRLLFLYFKDGITYCSVVHPSKVREFQSMLNKNSYNWDLKSWEWCVSNDVYFNQFRRCMRTLHGIKQPESEIEEFCRKYNVIKSDLTFKIGGL